MTLEVMPLYSTIMLIQKRSDWLQCKNGPLDVRLMQYTLHVFCLTLRKWKVLRRTVFVVAPFLTKELLMKCTPGIFSFTGALLGKIVIQGEHFSITNIYIYNKKIVLERKVLGSKTVSVLVADLSSVFENLNREEEVMVEPIEVFKWEKTESTKGDLIVSESSIVQYSESEAVGNIEINEIAVHSFWHNELIK